MKTMLFVAFVLLVLVSICLPTSSFNSVQIGYSVSCLLLTIAQLLFTSALCINAESLGNHIIEKENALPPVVKIIHLMRIVSIFILASCLFAMYCVVSPEDKGKAYQIWGKAYTVELICIVCNLVISMFFIFLSSDLELKKSEEA